MAIVDGYCDKTDLPPDMCAHCKNHVFEFPVMDETMVKVTGHGTMRIVSKSESLIIRATDKRTTVVDMSEVE